MTGIRWTAEELHDYRTRKRAHDLIETAVALGAVKESKLERRFAQQLAEAPDVPPAQRNYLFLRDREFEFDWAWARVRVAVEIQGMAHRIKGKFKADIEKRALALLAGWRVLELDGERVRSGQGLEWLRALLKSVVPGS